MNLTIICARIGEPPMATTLQHRYLPTGVLRLHRIVAVSVVLAHLGVMAAVLVFKAPPAPMPAETNALMVSVLTLSQHSVMPAQRAVVSSHTAPASLPLPSPVILPLPAQTMLPVLDAADVAVAKNMPVQQVIASSSVTTEPAPTVLAQAALQAVVPPDVRAAYANNPKPVYPLQSKKLHESGTSRLHVLVGQNGRVQDIEVDRSSGFSRLDRAAMAAVQEWKFTPARQGENTVAAWVFVPINWNLDE